MTLSERRTKLACHSLWKVYAGNADRDVFQGISEPAADPSAGTGIVAVRNVSFDVYDGEVFVIMGLSGSGKSTLVRCLSRLVEPSKGEVILDGRNLLTATDREMIEIRRHRMGMVFQNFALLPHLT